MNVYPYQFEAKIMRRVMGNMVFHVVYLPASLRKELRVPLKENPRLRVEGELNGRRFNLALQPSGGRWYLLLANKFLRTCKLKLGERVLVQFEIADQEAVDVPKELDFALRASEMAASRWAQLSAGKKRGLAYRVSSAKRIDTRERRVEEVIDSLLEDAQ